QLLHGEGDVVGRLRWPEARRRSGPRRMDDAYLVREGLGFLRRRLALRLAVPGVVLRFVFVLRVVLGGVLFGRLPGGGLFRLGGRRRGMGLVVALGLGGLRQLDDDRLVSAGVGGRKLGLPVLRRAMLRFRLLLLGGQTVLFRVQV